MRKSIQNTYLFAYFCNIGTSTLFEKRAYLPVRSFLAGTADARYLYNSLGANELDAF